MNKGLKQWIEDSYKNSRSLTDEELRDILFKPEISEHIILTGAEGMNKWEKELGRYLR